MGLSQFPWPLLFYPRIVKVTLIENFIRLQSNHMVKDVASSSPDYRQVTIITVFFYHVVYQNKTLPTN